jgi:hypothetical protein
VNFDAVDYQLQELTFEFEVRVNEAIGHLGGEPLKRVHDGVIVGLILEGSTEAFECFLFATVLSPQRLESSFELAPADQVRSMRVDQAIQAKTK